MAKDSGKTGGWFSIFQERPITWMAPRGTGGGPGPSRPSPITSSAHAQHQTHVTIMLSHSTTTSVYDSTQGCHFNQWLGKSSNAALWNVAQMAESGGAPPISWRAWGSAVSSPCGVQTQKNVLFVQFWASKPSNINISAFRLMHKTLLLSLGTPWLNGRAVRSYSRLEQKKTSETCAAIHYHKLQGQNINGLSILTQKTDIYDDNDNLQCRLYCREQNSDVLDAWQSWWMEKMKWLSTDRAANMKLCPTPASTVHINHISISRTYIHAYVCTCIMCTLVELKGLNLRQKHLGSH